MAGDLSKSRSMQNMSFFLGLLLVVAIVSSPTVIAWALQAHNDNASAETKTVYKTVTTADVAEATLVFTNQTGVLTKHDVKAQLTDVTNANSGGFDGIRASLTFSGTTDKGQNYTDLSKAEYLEIKLKAENFTVGKFLDNTVTGLAYTFRAVSSGEYRTNHLDAASNTKFHTNTAADFGLSTTFVYGDVKLLNHQGMTITDGSKVGTNYTKKATVKFVDLAQADLDGDDGQAGYDNQIVIRVDGYRHGRDGLASDDVIFSVQFEKPNAPGITSYKDGFAIGATLYGLAFLVGGALASPFYSLKDLNRYDRKVGKMGGFGR